MNLEKILVKNFKGIKLAGINIDKAAVYPIVGINESGKTSFLESLNFFNTYVKIVENCTSLIPSDLKSNFNDKISATYFFVLNDEEISYICDNFISANEYIITNKEIFKNITCEIKYNFRDSKYVDKENAWCLPILVKTKEDRNLVKLYEKDNALWNEIVVWISQSLITKILFLPSDISDVLNEYKLSENYYDDSLKDSKMLIGLDLLYKEAVKTKNDIWNDFSPSNIAELSNDIIDAKLLKMQKLLESKFSQEWKALIGKNSNAEIEFNLKYNVNKQTLSIKVLDNDKSENISQRSLGFRWLFAFVLITKFYDNENMLFILDEPAANLHSSAQKILLKIFADISKIGNKIIYSTHSPYLISPFFLENTYIIKNENIRGENGPEEFFTNKETKITITPYKQEINKSSSTTHYQAIIDALEYSPSMINFNSKFNIVLEGKNDQLTLHYFLKKLGIKKEYNLIPCKNADSSSSVMSILQGLSTDFIVLYDNDKEGKYCKNENNKCFNISCCYTLGDIIHDATTMESLVSSYDKKEKNLQNKKAVNFYINEAVSRNDYNDNWSNSTLENFKKIFDFFDSKGIKQDEK